MSADGPAKTEIAQPTAAPGTATSDADWVPGPASPRSREATWWLASAYGYMLVGLPTLDYLEDERIIGDLDHGAGWAVVLVVGAGLFATAIAWAWRGCRPRPGGRTLGSRRRFWWTLGLGVFPGAILLAMGVGMALAWVAEALAHAGGWS